MVIDLINACEMLVQLQALYLKRGSEHIHSFCNQGNPNVSANFDVQVLY